MDGLEGTGLVEKASVEHAGVAAAGLGAHVALLFQHRDAQPVAGQLSGDGAAHHAAADNDYVVGLLYRLSSFLFRGTGSVWGR